MQEIIDCLLSGEHSPLQIAEMLKAHNEKEVDEYNALHDQYTAAQLSNAEDRNLLKKHSEAADSLLIAHKDLKSKLSVAQAEAHRYKTMSNENRNASKLLANQKKNNKVLTDRNARVTSECKQLRDEVATLKVENSRLRITGNKMIGDYSFNLFPSKAKVFENGKEGRKVGIVVNNAEGCMAVITRTLDRKIVVPPMQQFELTDDHTDWLHQFFDIVDANHGEFTPQVLGAIN